MHLKIFLGSAKISPGTFLRTFFNAIFNADSVFLYHVQNSKNQSSNSCKSSTYTYYLSNQICLFFPLLVKYVLYLFVYIQLTNISCCTFKLFATSNYLHIMQNFSTSRHYRTNLSTDFESALKSALENGLKCVNKYFWDRQKCLPSIFEDILLCSF